MPDRGTTLLFNRDIIKSSEEDKQIHGPSGGTETVGELEEYQSKSSYFLDHS